MRERRLVIVLGVFHSYIFHLALRLGQSKPESLLKIIDERVGVIMAPNEYAEFLYLYPVKVTLRVLLDRGEFWVESVQTFEVPVGRPLPVRWRLGAASEEENWTLLALYSPEVKATQFQLRQLF